MRLAKSADQVAADAIGGDTPFRSLVVGCEGARVSGQCDSGYSCVYRNISRSGPQTPRPRMVEPRLLFDRLFAGMAPGLSQAERLKRLNELAIRQMRVLVARLSAGEVE